MDIKNKIIYKLDQLESYTEIISIAAGLIEEDFIRDPLVYGGAYRYIILGLEHVRDICILLRNIFNLNAFVGDNELLQVLVKNKVIPRWLAKNLLINIKELYEQQCDDLKETDKTKLYGKLDQIVSDFRHFKKYVLEYLK